MSPEKTYNTVQFAKAAGIGYSTLYAYKKAGKVPNTNTFTESDLQKFLEQHKKTAGAKKNKAEDGTNLDRFKTFTVEQAAKYLKIDKTYIYKLRKDGRLPNEQTFKKWQLDEYKAKYKGLRKIEKQALSGTTDEDVFQIHKNANPKKKDDVLLEKLIAKMLLLEPGSDDGVFVPRSAWQTKAKTTKQINEAKKVIVQKPGYENAVWFVKNFDNQEKEFTHAYIFRKL